MHVCICMYALCILTCTTISSLQIAEWVRGSRDKEISKLHTSEDTTFGAGAKLLYSMDAWRTLIRQAWLLGFLERDMVVAKGHNKLGGLIINTYRVSQSGLSFLSSPAPVLLPSLSLQKINTASNSTSIIMEHTSTRYVAMV